MTKREAIYRIINILKEHVSDTKLSKRLIWNIIQSSKNLIIDRDLRDKKLYRQAGNIKTICVEMEKISSNLCNCVELPSNCYVYRSKKKLPKMFSSMLGPFIYNIRTIDGNKEIIYTSARSAVSSSKIRNINNSYAFIENDYLYLTKDSYEMVALTSIFDENIDDWVCNKDNSQNVNNNKCKKFLDEDFGVPDRLWDSIFKMTEEELLKTFKNIQYDTLNNKSSNIETR